MSVHDEIELIYEDIRRFFESRDEDLVRPEATRPEVGFAALYTPPRHQPDLAIVGQNPGNFGPDNHVWDDEPNRRMMSGKIPDINSYIEHEHNFARTLQGFFDGASRRLLCECVGLNIWFFQARGTPDPPSQLASFCEQQAERILRAVQPKVILCLSATAFRRLKQEQAARFGHPDAPCLMSSFDGIPLIRAYHPTGSWSQSKAAASIPAAIGHIHAILNADGNQPPLTRLLPSRAAPAPSTRTKHRPARRRFRITEKGLETLDTKNPAACNP